MNAPVSSGIVDVLGIGANSVDYVYLLPAYPEADGPNAKMRISSHSLSCGGQVATALCTCASMGLRTKYIGATGTDDNGRRLREELARWQIDLTDAVIRDVTNQFAVIMVDEHAGERIVLWDRHDGLALRPRELPPELLTATRVLHVDDVDQDAAIRAARSPARLAFSSPATSIESLPAPRSWSRRSPCRSSPSTCPTH